VTLSTTCFSPRSRGQISQPDWTSSSPNAKRYVLWNQARSDIDIRKASEHGLGHLLEPTGDGPQAFAEAAWRIVLADHLGRPKPEPAWLDRPAVARLTITTPYLANILRTYNETRDYAARSSRSGSCSPYHHSGSQAS